MSNHCWTGNGSSFDASSSVTAVVESHNYWTLLLLVFPVLTVFGNVLVVLGVYRERSLQSATNYFIVSLAIADIMVAILVMPLAVYVEVRIYPWPFSLPNKSKVAYLNRSTVKIFFWQLSIFLVTFICNLVLWASIIGIIVAKSNKLYTQSITRTRTKSVTVNF